MSIHEAGPSAALAGVPAGIQSQGAWAGRRQLFVRFAAEAETAVMYTADALAKELRQCLGDPDRIRRTTELSQRLHALLQHPAQGAPGEWLQRQLIAAPLR